MSDVLSDIYSEVSDTSYTSDLDDRPNATYYDLSNGSPLDRSKFILVHYNVDSILTEGRLDELQTLCKTVNVAVLVITESHLDTTIPDNIITLQGYHTPLRKDRQTNGRYGGGVLIYIAEQLTYKHRPELESEYFEHLWVDVCVNKYTCTVTSYYRPPIENTESHNLFLEVSEDILNNLSNHTTDNKIIASDFNFGNCYCKYPVLQPKPLDRTAPDLFANYGFSQLIDIPTRLTLNTTSLIDLIFVENEQLVNEFGTLPKIADHEGTIVCLDIKREQIKTKTRTFFDYKNADLAGLENYIKTFDFQQKVFSHDVYSQTSIYTDLLVDAFTQFVPTKTVSIKVNDPPWCNTYTRLLLRKKNRNYGIFRKANSNLNNTLLNFPNNHELITILKTKKDRAHKNSRIAANESLKANRRVKNNFYNSVNQTMNNPEISSKKKFSILIKLMNSQKFSTIPPLIENNKTVNDPGEKSNIFNNHFSSKSTVLNSEDVPPELHRKAGTQIFDKVNTSPIEVARIIRGIKKSHSSYCGVPGKFLSLIATPISFSMSKLFNNLFEIGHYPDLWKISHVTAIYKRKGSKNDKKNFRPISLLPTTSKICEAILHQRLLTHCTENNVITERQAAYLKGDSTTHQLLYLVHKIKLSWTKQSCTRAVFLDVDGAFDKIWHNGLTAKLKQIGIDGKLLQLFESYLKNRKQIVVVDNIKSTVQDIKAGVPQGSKLGPL